RAAVRERRGAVCARAARVALCRNVTAGPCIQGAGGVAVGGGQGRERAVTVGAGRGTYHATGPDAGSRRTEFAAGRMRGGDSWAPVAEGIRLSIGAQAYRRRQGR